MNISKLFGDFLRKLIYHKLCRLSEFNSWNVILFQTKVFGENIKETTLARYFVKLTARLNFTRSKIIRTINRVH